MRGRERKGGKEEGHTQTLPAVLVGLLEQWAALLQNSGRRCSRTVGGAALELSLQLQTEQDRCGPAWEATTQGSGTFCILIGSK